MPENTFDLFKAERDTLVGLGLLAHTYQHFDPSLKSGETVAHSFGYNVHCIVIDNTDGEVLGAAQNRIHADDNPLQHAEQLGVRVAIGRLHIKRPRAVGQKVEDYYRKNLFMAPGTGPADYVNVGCTLYNTFDPCGFCATTLLVCYMKRIAYLFEDDKFKDVYKYMGDNYFKNRESQKEQLALVTEGNGTLRTGAEIIRRLQKKVNELANPAPAPPGRPAPAKVDLVSTLDGCFVELGEAANCLASVRETDLSTTGEQRIRNARTLDGLRAICRLS
jgi:tRNA(Arg) A34 adenosine deaminase TadA